MIVLDTNVISETVMKLPDPNVVEWYRRHAAGELATTAITVAELFDGICGLPAGRRRDDLARIVDHQLTIIGENRILPFDGIAAIDYSEIRADRRKAGRPISVQDAMIAAIARSRGAVVATRNMKDFEGTGVELINPWEHQGDR